MMEMETMEMAGADVEVMEGEVTEMKAAAEAV